MGVFYEPRHTKSTVEPALRKALGNALVWTPTAPGPAAGLAEADTFTASEVAPILQLVPNNLRGVYEPSLTTAIRTAALQPVPPAPAAADLAAASIASQTTAPLPDDSAFQSSRFLVAVLIFAVVVGAAIWTDADGLSDSSKALYGFAASIFGLVVGLLGGEKPNGN